MEAAAASSTEIHLLGWSVILLFAHIVAQTLFYIRDTGRGYALTNREEDRPVTPVTDRLTRGLHNFIETYPAFIGLALALAVTGKTGGTGATGALIWFWARLVYVPVFAAGIIVLRTAVWTVSVIGLLLMLIRLMA
jgi:uncharacterized MAPEG superfamily protein